MAQPEALPSLVPCMGSIVTFSAPAGCSVIAKDPRLAEITVQIPVHSLSSNGSCFHASVPAFSPAYAMHQGLWCFARLQLLDRWICLRWRVSRFNATS